MPARRSMRVLMLREGAVLLELASLDVTLALFEALEADPVAGVLEIVPAARTLLITHDPLTISAEQVAAEAVVRLGMPRKAGMAEVVEIPVRYDGEDLADVAELLGISTQEVIRRHVEADYLVAFTGFAPGFAYLSAPDAGLHVPRRASPRTHVPAGAVGLAGEFSGIYPKVSPGGWQLIGTTPLAMFDLGRKPAALLQPGQHVRFRDMAGATVHPVAKIPAENAKPAAAALVDGIEGLHLDVLSAGLPALFQDHGRPGLAAQGISRSGAADRASLSLANRITGNPADAAALEIAPAVFTFRVSGRAVIAVTGAERAITIQPERGPRISAPMNRPLALEQGDRVTLEAPTAGLRSYLALRGGFAVEPVLGSASADTLAQIGPAAVTSGARLRAASGMKLSAVEPEALSAFAMPRAGEAIVLDVVPGPRTDWFTPASAEQFLTVSWAATSQASRTGLRLSGPVLERAVTGELPSEGTLRGAIQVPANGQPVLFLADHPLTGGYPVMATVAAYHLDLAGQIPPGAFIRFRAVRPFTAYSLCAGDTP